MALAYDARRATRDIDAVFQPKDEVYAAAAAVAARHDLPEDWLNDGVKGFLPGDDPRARQVYESNSLRVDVASPEYLLAMKLLAAREQDVDDIVLLYRPASEAAGTLRPSTGDVRVDAALAGLAEHLTVSGCGRGTPWPWSSRRWRSGGGACSSPRRPWTG